MIVGRFIGPEPSARFLDRIRAGQLGGVILFSDNTTGGVSAVRALTAELQRTARQGGNPPLLIMTDQEGGTVNRLPGPPYLAPADMTSTAVASAQGTATGRLLRSVGVNVDLAPVADVERVPNSFLGTRSFGSNPNLVGQHACAFALGLASQGVAYTLKHFPGLGRATANTDLEPVTINATANEIRNDYLAYFECANTPNALIMISNASYPNLSGPLPAVMSPEIYQQELRLASPQRPATISDDLQAGALKTQPTPARAAINAGLDLLLYASTENGSATAYQLLLADVQDGSISTARIRNAANAIAGLKRTLG